jgi:hypothetical protein
LCDQDIKNIWQSIWDNKKECIHGNFGNNTKNTSQNIWDEIREHILNHVLYQKVITNNEHLICLHAQKIQRKTDAFEFQTWCALQLK